MEEYAVDKRALGDYSCYLDFIKQRGLPQTLTVMACIHTKKKLTHEISCILQNLKLLCPCTCAFTQVQVSKKKKREINKKKGGATFSARTLSGTLTLNNDLYRFRLYFPFKLKV